MRRLRNLFRDEHGSATVEIVLIAPAIMLLLLAAIGVGRIQMAGNNAESAAGNGARAATMQTDQGSADQAARQAVTDTLTANDIDCKQLTIDLDTRAVENQLGQVGSVTVTVTCLVNLSDVAVPGLPGTYTIKTTGTSPINPYSER